MEMDSYQSVKHAIKNQLQVVATYKGHRREMCPHALGFKFGRRKALFFQFAGGSSSGLPPGGEWRCLFVDELSYVEVRGGEWHSGDRHSRPQTCVDIIDVEIPY